MKRVEFAAFLSRCDNLNPNEFLSFGTGPSFACNSPAQASPKLVFAGLVDFGAHRTNEDPCYGRDLLRFQPVYAERDIDVRPRAGRETFEEASWKVRSSPSIVASSSDGKRCP